MLCRKNNKDFVKNYLIWEQNWLFLGQKVVKLGIQKQLWQPKLQTFFELDFCFESSKDQLKMCKITILSSHAWPEK